MANITEPERLIKVETLLEKLTEFTEKGFKEVNDRLEYLSNSFVSQQKHEDDLRDVDRELKRVKKQIQEVERKRWIQNTFSAVLGALLSLLIAYFINNVGQ